MRCPKCNSRNVETYHEEASAWTLEGRGKPSRVFHCSACGMWKFGEAAEQIVNEFRQQRTPSQASTVYTPERRVVPSISEADRHRMATVKARAEALGKEAQGYRNRVGSNDDNDRAINLAMVEAAQALQRIEDGMVIRSSGERHMLVQQAEDLLARVQSRMGPLRALPEPEPAPAAKCAWMHCTNSARETSKYCSLDCRHRFARHQHKMRNRAEANVTTEDTNPDAGMSSRIRKFRAEIGVPVPDVQFKPTRGGVNLVESA